MCGLTIGTKRINWEKSMKLMQSRLCLALASAVMLPAAWGQTYDISTLAGKVASVNGTAGLQIRFSAFIEEESEDTSAPGASAPITPVNVLSSPLTECPFWHRTSP